MDATRVGVRWHNERRRKLFAAHPTVRSLAGPNPWTALIIVALVALQLTLSALFSDKPWWLLVLLAYGVGAFIAHALGVLIHDATHDLVFRAPRANRAVAMVANVPLVFPASMDFRVKHLKHHAHIGEPDGADTQAPKNWEFRLATTRPRTLLAYSIAPVWVWPAQSVWILINLAVQVAFLVPWFIAFGPKALFFLGASGVFAFAPHPVGMRRYGEHLVLVRDQPTTSYYGKLNWLSFDVGYHVEHHDLPSVPWNRLRSLHAAAPELYQSLAFIPSWTVLLWRMLTVPGEGPERYFLEDHQLASKLTLVSSRHDPPARS